LMNILTYTITVPSQLLGDPIAAVKWLIRHAKEEILLTSDKLVSGKVTVFDTWDINAHAPRGMKKTLLGSAVYNKHWATVYLLLELGADPNIADVEGWTPLHTAAAKQDANICTLLMSYGADENLRNENDHAQTPMEMANACRSRLKADVAYRELLARDSKAAP
jgi:hypothetical protein